MNQTDMPTIHHALHDECVDLLRRHGPHDLEWLTRRARARLRDARIDQRAVSSVVDVSTLLVPRPDGMIDYLARVLDGMVLTQRVRAPLAGRQDLWCGVSLQPLLSLASVHPIPLADGGEVVEMPSGEDVLVGPPGWLPDVRRFDLVGLRLVDGRLRTEAVDSEGLPGLAEQNAVRTLIADHYRRERWWRGGDDLESRPGELVRALTLARQEDPGLLSTPHPPLQELLYDPLERGVDEHHWRDFAAMRQEHTVSFGITGMPEALHMELSHRADTYGMSVDQFVIALLGHLAWRTPFAEDMQPFDAWVPDSPARIASIHAIDGAGDDDPA